jgi:hypothetical protein
MKWISLLSLVLIAACSQTPKKNPAKYEVVRISPKEIQACLVYQKSTLDQAYTVQKDNSIQFTRDFNMARALIQNFDIEKGLTKPRATMVQNILSQCDEESIKAFNAEYKRTGACSLMWSELNFFQGLAVAIKKYPWPADLQLEGKKIALDYVRYYSQGHFPLINRLVALSVLDELSVNQIVNKDLHPEIKILMQESQAYVQGLKMKLNKDPALSCESMEIIREELSYADELGNKMQGLLSRI